MKTTLLLTCAIFSTLSISSAAAIDLPVEVLSGNGPAEVKVTVNVPKGKGAAVTSLWMLAHNLSYERKAAVQVNGGEWLMLTNTTARVTDKVKKLGGIGGPLGALDLTVPAQVKDGKNILTFRYSGPNAFSSGYTVVDFNLRSSAGENVLPANNFRLVYPEKLPPFSTDPVRIEEGRKLWSEAPLVRSPLVPTPLKTTCGGCHAPNGADLKYFRFSRKRIQQRAIFHGLTSQQGRDIADYVWSGSTVPTGWVWDPPYQPGPGLDSRPVQEWAAGAGIRSVLAADADLLPYLFPGGLATGNLTSLGNPNLRELPISLPLPDWHRWLPRIHPRDAWGQAFTDSPFFTYWKTIQDAVAAAPDKKAFVQSGQFKTLLNNWYARRQEFLKPRAEDWPADQWTSEHADKVYSTALWQLVQLWALMQQYGLEGYGPPGYERSWQGNLLFAASPFMLKIPSNQNGVGGSALHNEYFASIWYWTQLALNPDNQGAPAGQSPVDWAYTYGKLKDFFGVTGYAEPMRLTAVVVKSIKVWDNDRGLDKFQGWNPDNKADICRLVHPSFVPMWADTPANTRRDILKVTLDAWLAVCRKYTSSQYWGVGYADPAVAPVANYSGDLGQKMAYSTPEMKKAGADVIAVELWCRSLWPLGPWKIGAEGAGD